MIIYKIVSPISNEPIYIGSAIDVPTARRNLYWTDNAGLSAEITAIRALGAKPIIEVLEEVSEDQVWLRKEYWLYMHCVHGCKLHNKERISKRKARRIAPQGTVFQVSVPDELLKNKTFRRFIGYEDHKYKLVSARMIELLIEKIELLEWAES